MIEPKAGHFDFKLILEEVERNLDLLDEDEGDFVYLLPRDRRKALAAYDPYNLQV